MFFFFFIISPKDLENKFYFHQKKGSFWYILEKYAGEEEIDLIQFPVSVLWFFQDIDMGCIIYNVIEA